MKHDYTNTRYGIKLLDEASLDTVVEVTDIATGRTVITRYPTAFFMSEYEEENDRWMSVEQWRNLRLEMIADDATLDQMFEEG